MSVSKGEYKGVMQIIATQIEKTNKHWHKVIEASPDLLPRHPIKEPAKSWTAICSMGWPRLQI